MRVTDVDYLLSTLSDDVPYEAAAKRILLQAPVIKIESAEPGHWVKRDNTDKGFTFLCSRCGGTAYARPNTRGLRIRIKCTYKYCPNCGIRMVVEE